MKFLILILISFNAWSAFTPFPPTPIEPGSLSSKAEVFSHDGSADAVLAPGTAGQVLTIDLAETTGLKWTEPVVGGVPLMLKGSLLTSNGTANGEFVGCNDGERMEWDSAIASGIKCVTVSGPNYQLAAGIVGFANSAGPGATYLSVPNTSLTITTTGDPVSISLKSFSGVYQISSSGTGTCYFAIFRDEVVVSQIILNNASYAAPIEAFDVVVAGTYTYEVRWKSISSPTCQIENARLTAIEIK